MSKELHVNFEQISLDGDHNSVKMILKDIEGEEMILHFSKSERVELLHNLQNHIYNTRQEYKRFIREVKQDQERQELELRKKINEATAKDIKVELQKQLDILKERSKK